MVLHPKWIPAATKKAGPEAVEKYERKIRGSRDGLERLREIIAQDLKALEAPKSLDDYAPGWDYKQADKLGQVRVYRNLLTILEFANGR